MATIKSNIYIRFNDNVLFDIDVKDFEINLQLKDIKNLSESKTSFSIPIKVPYTPESTNIFSTLFNVNNISTITDQKIDAKLIYKNKVIVNGYLYVDSFDMEYIYVIISRADLGIFEDIKDLNLSDLNFTGSTYEYNQKTRRTRINDAEAFDPLQSSGYTDVQWIEFDWWNDAGNWTQLEGYVANLVSVPGDLMGFSKFNNLKLNHQHTPVLKVKTIFNKIFEEQGYTYSASSAFLDKIDKLYMTTTVPIEKYSEDIESRYYFQEIVGVAFKEIKKYDGIGLNSGSTYVFMHEWAGTDADAKGVSTIFGYPSIDDKGSISGTLSPLRLGQEVEIDLNIYGRYITGNTGNITITLQTPSANSNKNTDNVNENVVKLESVIFTQNSIGQLYTTTTIYVPEYPALTINNVIEIKYEFDNAEAFSLTDESGKEDAGIVYRTKNYIYNTGTTYTLNDLLSDNYSQTNFLNDLFIACNIYIVAEEGNKKHLNLLTYDDFYIDDVLDWSDKITLKKINITDTNKNLYDEYLYSNILGNDNINKSFNDTYDKTLGQEKIINDNELSINRTEKISLTAPRVIFNNNYVLPFNGGIMDIDGSPVITEVSHLPIGSNYSNYSNNILFGYLNKFNTGDSEEYYSNDNNILTYNPIDGEDDTGKFSQFNVTGAVIDHNLFTLSPYRLTGSTYNPQELASADTFAWIYNTEDTFVNSLTGGSITNNNLYTNFWFNDLQRKLGTQQKFLEVNMYLTEDDVKIENFRKRIWIDNDKLGGAYYNIQKIVFPSDETKLSKVELISDVRFSSTPDSLVNVNLYQYNSDTDSVSKL